MPPNKGQPTSGRETERARPTRLSPSSASTGFWGDPRRCRRLITSDCGARFWGGDSLGHPGSSASSCGRTYLSRPIRLGHGLNRGSKDCPAGSRQGALETVCAKGAGRARPWSARLLPSQGGVRPNARAIRPRRGRNSLSLAHRRKQPRSTVSERTTVPSQLMELFKRSRLHARRLYDLQSEGVSPSCGGCSPVAIASVRVHTIAFFLFITMLSTRLPP